MSTNSSGIPTNSSIELDLLDGSILVDIPYLAMDGRAFMSTEAKASVLFGGAIPLFVILKKYKVKNIDN